MNLIVDDGNSFVKLYLVEKDRVIRFLRFKFNDSSSAAKKIDDFIRGSKVQDAAVLSVGGHLEQLLEILSVYFQPFVFTHQSAVPLRNRYSTPGTLGLDRLAAAVGASMLYPKENLLVIDIGSAVTYDFVTDKGEFLGGNISPGIDFRFRSLHDYTAALPLIKANELTDYIGKSTAEAITNGVLLGLLFEIEGYIAHFCNRFEKLRTILTGGGAKFFEKKIKNSIFVQIHLVAIGLNHIMQYNRN